MFLQLPDNNFNKYSESEGVSNEKLKQHIPRPQNYFPHLGFFTFNVKPSELASLGKIESREKIINNLPWKIFVKAGGKDYYPFIEVGIVNHNNVEEIDFVISLLGFEEKLDETRRVTLAIDDSTNPSITCPEKIWYRSLFNESSLGGIDDKEEEKVPLQFEVCIKFRCHDDEQLESRRVFHEAQGLSRYPSSYPSQTYHNDYSYPTTKSYQNMQIIDPLPNQSSGSSFIFNLIILYIGFICVPKIWEILSLIFIPLIFWIIDFIFQILWFPCKIIDFIFVFACNSNSLFNHTGNKFYDYYDEATTFNERNMAILVAADER